MHLSTHLLVPIALALTVALPALGADGAAQPMPLAVQSLLLDIAQAGTRVVAVGERGHVLYSDDEGAHWQQAAVPVRVMLTAVWFVDESRGWAVGHDGMIVASSDSGASWTLERDGLLAQRELDRAAVAQARERVEALGAVANEDNEAQAAQREQAGLELEDAEATLAEPVAPPPLFDVRFTDAAHGFAVGAFGSLLVTEDGGAHWSDARARIGDPDRNHLYAIAAPDPDSLLIAGEAGQVFQSRDGGASWQPRASGHTGTLFGLVAVPGTRSVYAFGLQGSVLYSSDGGEAWVELASPVRGVLGGGFVARDGAVWIVGSMGSLLRADEARLELHVGSTRRSNLSAAAQLASGELIAAGQAGIERLDTTASGTR